jgi:integrase
MDKLPRYVQSRDTVKGKAYYFIPPKKYILASLTDSVPLGLNLKEAIATANDLNKALDDALLDLSLMGDDTETKIQGTVTELFAKYTADHRFQSLAPESKKVYRRAINMSGGILMNRGVRFTDFPLSDLNARHADEFYSKFKTKHSEILAAQVCRVLRRVFNIGFRWGMIPANPFTGMELPAAPERDTLWTEANVQTFFDTAVNLDLENIGWIIRLGYATAQRVTDILNLTTNSVKIMDDKVFILVVQNKTKAIVTIPIIDDELAEFITSRPERYLVGNPITNERYSYWTYNVAFIKIREAAGLPDTLQNRDLRRTVATELGNAGATQQEIDNITGWKPGSKMSARYVRKTVTQAVNAMDKRRKMKEKV